MQSGVMLCSEQDVYDVWSNPGVQGRYDDDLSGTPATAPELLILDRFIMRASSVVSAKLKDRYKTVDFQGSNPPVDTPIGVNWYTSIIAAYFTAIRKGMPSPGGIETLYKATLEDLNKIAVGAMSLAEVNESFDYLPFVTNLTVDSNYRNAKLRKLNSISTTAEPSPNSGRKTFPESFPNRGLFID